MTSRLNKGVFLSNVFSILMVKKPKIFASTEGSYSMVSTIHNYKHGLLYSYFGRLFHMIKVFWGEFQKGILLCNIPSIHHLFNYKPIVFSTILIISHQERGNTSLNYLVSCRNGFCFCHRLLSMTDNGRATGLIIG